MPKPRGSEHVESGAFVICSKSRYDGGRHKGRACIK